MLRTAAEVLATVKAAGKGAFHIVYQPRLNRKVDEAQFNVVCKIAMAARNVTFIADEIHTKTLRVSPAEILDLTGYQFIHRNTLTGKISKG